SSSLTLSPNDLNDLLKPSADSPRAFLRLTSPAYLYGMMPRGDGAFAFGQFAWIPNGDCMRAHRLIQCICISVALGLTAPMASAQGGPAGLRAALDAAWQRSPQARTLEA